MTGAGDGTDAAEAIGGDVIRETHDWRGRSAGNEARLVERRQGADDPLAQLVDRMADGDEAAAAALHRALHAHLLRIAFACLRNRADAEEVVSAALMKAWSDSANFDARRGSVTAWLTMMVSSRARDAARAIRRRFAATSNAVAMALVDGSADGRSLSSADDIVRTLEAQESGQELASSLRRLPAAQRTAIELVFFGCLSHTQAAERLGVPLGTIKTRVRLGLRQMRMTLAGAGVMLSDSAASCD